MIPKNCHIADLVARHRGLAVSEARRRMRPGVVDSDDLLQAALLGLLEAALRFDPERGTFASFALPSIRGQLSRALAAARVVRHGAKLRAHFGAVTRARRELENVLQREPTLGEIAQASGVPTAAVHALLAPAPLSLDAEGPEGVTLHELLADPRTPSPTAAVSAAEIRALVARLPPRESALVQARFFALDDPTHAEVGARFGLSAARALEIERRALRRLWRALRFERGRST